METQTLQGDPQNAPLPCIANTQPSWRVQAAKYHQWVLRPSEMVEAIKIEAINRDHGHSTFKQNWNLQQLPFFCQLISPQSCQDLPSQWFCCFRKHRDTWRDMKERSLYISIKWHELTALASLQKKKRHSHYYDKKHAFFFVFYQRMFLSNI